MAPRKAGKHTETEVAERSAEAGDVSPPKRKKTVAKTVNKSEEEKQIRLPRAAKAAKVEQTEPSETIANLTKNAKAKNKTLPSKTTSAPAKVNSKVKSKKGKDVDEKDDENVLDGENVKDTEEIQTKKKRTKATTKKAGMDANEEPKAKRRAKKNTVSDNIENSEVLSVEKKKNVNNETVPNNIKPKGKAGKKKPDDLTEPKNIVSNAKNKASVDDSMENNDEKKEMSKSSQKGNRKPNSEKPVKTIVRKTRGKKLGVTAETALETEEDTKAAEESPVEPSQSSDSNNPEQNEESDTTNSLQTSKKGKNGKKKEEPQKKVTKTRGKVIPITEESLDAAKGMKDSQKKVNKENTSVANIPKKGRGKKANTITTSVVTEEDSNNTAADDKRMLHSTQTLVINNNITIADIKIKNEELEEEDPKSTKSSGVIKKQDETSTSKNENDEDDTMNTSVEEEN